MKKLITSTIIVLPLIILAILLVSGAIMSLTTHIYVEAIDLTKEDAIRLRMEDETNPPTYNLANDITVLPLKATNRALVYKSEDENIVSISANGVITAKFYGETYVSVTSKENKAATRKRKVVVWDDKVHAVKIDDQEPNQKIDLYSNTKAMQLTASVYPVEAKNKGIKWVSSAPEILEVTQNGTLNVRGVGEVTVSAVSVENDQIFDTVTVVCHAKLTDIVFDKSAVSTAEEHLTFPQNIELRPATTDPADIKYSYKSSNDEIATVNEAGEISFKQPGQVEITITATDFGGTQKSYSKIYESTCGYFSNPIFKMTELNWNACHSGEDLLQYQYAQLPNTTKGIGEITCIKDGADSVEDVVVFNQQNKFVFGENLECLEKFDVTIHATAYDFNQHKLVETEQTLHINKTPSESGRSAVVTYKGDELPKNEIYELTLADIGESVELEITGTEVAPIINDNFYVTASHANNTITLTAKHAKPDGQSMTLTLGVSVYNLLVKVEAKAHEISVEFNSTKIESATYNSLFDNLTLTVNPTRKDSEDITNKTIGYKYGSLGWQYAEPGEIEIENLTSGENQIEFSCGDVKFKFTVKLITLEDFGVKISNTISGGVGWAELGSFESAKSLEGEQLVRLSSNSLDSLTLEIVPNVELLGGFGSNENFKTLFTLTFNPTAWQQNYDTTNKQITLGFAGEQDFNNLVELTYAAITLQFRFLRTNLNSIDFTGFDSKTDNYAGYQQVRVFAKHSFYGTQESEQAVDYFKIPLEALRNDEQPASLDALTWTLTRYVGDKAESVLTTQLGKEITYNGAKYTLEQAEGGYVLKDAEGNTVVGTDGKNPNGITFVDCFSETGFARIYFGNFVGLRETDIQNDYFGNFDEQTNWKEPAQTVDDGSGRAREKSTKNSFAFLRVEAGDGAEHGTNRHFNFNVLNDLGEGDANRLINVDSTTGYYKFSNVVLQNDLYGAGENPDAPESQVLTSTNNIDKTYIFGNGHKLNLKAVNDNCPASNEGTNPVSFKKLFNLKLFGDNANNKIDGNTQRVLLHVDSIYYCEMSYYYKLNPLTNTSLCVKNSTFYGVAKAAVQLWQSSTKLYMENVTMASCVVGVSVEQPKTGLEVNLKGFFDIIDYNNKDGLDRLLKGSASMFMSNVLDAAKNYFEFFGQNISDLNDAFVNVMIYSDYSIQDKVRVWNGEKYENQTSGATLEDGTKIANVCLVPIFNTYFAWTYGIQNSVDGAVVEFKYSDRQSLFGGKEIESISATRDNMGKIFNEERNLRLLCQYLTKDKMNSDHILWHMQKAYRNPALHSELVEEGHLENLKNSLLKENLPWPDGSTPQQAVEALQAAQNLNKALTTFILPEKKEY